MWSYREPQKARNSIIHERWNAKQKQQLCCPRSGSWRLLESSGVTATDRRRMAALMEHRLNNPRSHFLSFDYFSDSFFLVCWAFIPPDLSCLYRCRCCVARDGGLANWLPIHQSITRGSVDSVSMGIYDDDFSLQLSSTSSSDSSTEPAEIKELRLSSAHAMIFLSQQVGSLIRPLFIVDSKTEKWSIYLKWLYSRCRNGIRRQTWPSPKLYPPAYRTTQRLITWCWSTCRILHMVFIFSIFISYF